MGRNSNEGDASFSCRNVSPGASRAGAAALPLLLIFACANPLWAQYRVYQWESFETGQLAPGYSLLGERFETQVRVVDYATLTPAPPGLFDGTTASEVGERGLAITAGPENPLLGLGVGVILERSSLGAKGRALYQADFFVPDETQPIPSLAVLAMEPLAATEREPVKLYRFGCTKNRDYYFSLIEKGSQEAALYKFDRTFLKKIPRSGWHRYQIVFEGPSTIRCFVDGHEAPFSPLEETRLDRLQVGIMVAEREKDYVCYADNLSIQWTTEDAPLPDSPYAASWGEAPVSSPGSTPPSSMLPEAVPPAAQTGHAAAATSFSAAPSGTFQWLDPDTAWTRSSGSGTPMLVYFHAPRVPNTVLLNQMMATNPAAQVFLSRHVLAGVDVNQLQGGTVAAKFGVFRVPTFILFDPSGKEVARITFDRNHTWDEIQAALTPGGASVPGSASEAPGRQQASSQVGKVSSGR